MLPFLVRYEMKLQWIGSHDLYISPYSGIIRIIWSSYPLKLRENPQKRDANWMVVIFLSLWLIHFCLNWSIWAHTRSAKARVLYELFTRKVPNAFVENFTLAFSVELRSKSSAVLEAYLNIILKDFPDFRKALKHKYCYYFYCWTYYHLFCHRYEWYSVEESQKRV